MIYMSVALNDKNVCNPSEKHSQQEITNRPQKTHQATNILKMIMRHD